MLVWQARVPRFETQWGNNNFLRIVVICEEGESEFGVIGVGERGREVFGSWQYVGKMEFYFLVFAISKAKENSMNFVVCVIV